MALRSDHRIYLLALLAGAPALAVTAVLLWRAPHSTLFRVTLLGLLVLPWLWAAAAVRRHTVRPLRVLANLLAGIREGQLDVRARGDRPDDPLHEVYREFNLLGGALHEQRLGAVEADALLRRVMEEIDVAVFAFASDRTIRLANRAAERLLGQPVERMQGRTAAYFGLDPCLEGETPRILDPGFLGGIGRWEVRRRSFRQGGLPMELVVLADVSRALRQEEREAWRRLIRVLSHEINNSLAPIKSLAGTLLTLLDRTPRPADHEEDLRRGIAVIAGRAESLDRFMAAYARLAKLPEPTLVPMAVEPWIRRVVALETRYPVEVMPGAAVTIPGDQMQLEQALINLIKNAVEAMEGGRPVAGAGVRVGWRVLEELGVLEVWVADTGPGIGSSANLFVPFFTTKPNGSGVGLALSRQVAEAHRGSLILENRPVAEGTGCIARLRLPMRPITGS